MPGSWGGEWTRCQVAGEEGGLDVRWLQRRVD